MEGVRRGDSAVSERHAWRARTKRGARAGCGAAQRDLEDQARGKEERDAHELKLCELAERVWNGAADRVVVQAPANVSAEGVRRGESAVSERCA